MIECDPGHIRFGKESKKLLNFIRSKQKLGALLQTVNVSAVMYSIFFRNNALTSSYYLTQQDFKTFAEATKGLNRVVRKVIHTEIEKYILYNSNYSGEGIFWECMEKAYSDK